MARRLAEVLDQYLPPAARESAPPAAGLVFVPVLAGDATVGAVTRALAARIVARGRPCTATGADAAAQALLGTAEVPAPSPAGGLEFRLGTTAPRDARAALLFCCPGWELRADLLPESWADAGDRRWLFALSLGDPASPASAAASTAWQLRGRKLGAASVEAVTARFGVEAVLGHSDPQSLSALDGLARRLGDAAALPPLGAFSRPGNAAE